jgi:hypothetical protein
MTPLALSGLFSIGEKLIDKLFTSDEDKAKAHLELLRLQQSGELELLKTQLSAIVAEAQSPDPWTSRARPSFMYVMYVLILASIPMGILAAFKPDVADAITKGMTGYLAAIPEPLYVLFGTGYLGYTAARQWGKAKGIDK